MDFQGRYQILEMLNDGEARTFKALQTSSGRTVLLHQLWVERTPPNQPDLASLVFGFLRHATADEMKILVDMGEEGDRVYVVTEDMPVFQDLRKWLQSRAGTPEAAGKATGLKPAPRADSGAGGASGGSPTQAKQESLTSPDGTTQLFTPTNVAKPPVAAPAPSKAKGEISEFTRAFFGNEVPKPQSARPVSSPPDKPSAPSTSKAEKPPESQPSAGFEVAFWPPKQQPRGPTPPAVEKPLPPSPPAPSPQGGASGEFTRIFFSPEESKAMPSGPAPAAGTTRQTPFAPAQPPQPEGPGEFTRLFRGPQIQEKPPAAPSVEARPSQPMAPPAQPTEQAGSGEFTQLFRASPGAARPAGSPLAPSSPKPPIPLSSSPAQQSPGELTQLMQGYQVGKSAEKPALFEEPGPVVPPPPTKVREAGPGAFTQIFQRPSDLATPPPAAPAPPVAKTPPTAPQPPEQDEYMRMFELPGGGAGAAPQSAPQAPPAAATPPSAGRAMPAIPGVYVSPPVAPSMPYVQPPVVSPPVVPQPQPFQMASPQFQPPAVQSPYVTVPQPVMPQMPQMQPITVPVPAAPQAGPPKAGKGKFLVPLLILGGLFVVAVVVVLIFALKH